MVLPIEKKFYNFIKIISTEFNFISQRLAFNAKMEVFAVKKSLNGPILSSTEFLEEYTVHIRIMSQIPYFS